MRSLGFILVFTGLSTLGLFAQKEANWWYFGVSAGLNFNTMTNGFPTGVANGGMFTMEGNATISDRNGNLLFYTDGRYVFDRTHKFMPNGSNLNGSATTTMATFIVPFPGNKDKYYVFTLDDFTKNASNTRGFCYTVVDMSLRNGLGDVVTSQKNQFITGLTCERMAVTKKAGGGYWIVVQLKYSNTYSAYAVTSSGVSTTPVNTVIGPTPTQINGAGYMKFNQQGDKLGLVYSAPPAPGSKSMLLDFNTTTGVLSNILIDTVPYGPYGLEFSPDGKKMYVACYWSSKIHQFNAYSSTNTAFSASRKLVNSSTKNGLAAIQLGPDGKIYGVTPGVQQLLVIQNPNATGTACNLTNSGPTVPSTASVSYGLPVFVPSYLSRKDLVFKNACAKQWVTVALGDTTNVDSILYNYGDPTSGTNNFSVNVLDSHKYASSGKYGIKAFVYRSISSGLGGTRQVVIDTLMDSITVGSVPIVQLGMDTAICNLDSISASVQSKDPYTLWWNDSIQDLKREIDSSQIYWALASNSCGIGVDSIQVSLIELNAFNLGNDTILCRGDSLNIALTDTALSYQWMNGSNTRNYTERNETWIWVEASTVCESFRDSLYLSIDDPILITLGNDTAFCAPTPPLLQFSAGNHKRTQYLWSDGSTQATNTISNYGVTWLSASNACGVSSDSIHILKETPISINLGNDTSFCEGQHLLLDSKIKGTSVWWNTGDTQQVISVSTAGTYKLSVQNSCGIFSDSVIVSMHSNHFNPLPDDTILCDQTNLQLQVQSKFNQISWSTGETVSSIQISSPGLYAVQVDNACGAFSDTISIDFQSKPNVNLGPDLLLCNGDQATLAVPLQSNQQITWSTGSTDSGIQVHETGQYFVSISNDCGTGTDSINITQGENPSPNLGSDTTVCDGDKLIFTRNQIVSSDAQLYWQNSSRAKNDFTIKRSGTYIVRAINTCGEGRDTIRVRVMELPEVGLPSLDLCQGPVSINLNTYTSYTIKWWDDDDRKNKIIEYPGDYNVYIEDEIGCSNIQYFDIKDCTSDIYIPNAFTPNYDGQNEGFRVYANTLYNFKLTIYDQWNNLIFESDDLHEEWQGVSASGDNCAIGTYIWKLQYSTEEDQFLQVKTGAVHLIR